MEPEVHLIEKFFQEVMRCFTMTNIICKSRKEIDLLVINPKTSEKYHIEAYVSTSRSFALKEQDLEYFHKEKFEHPKIKEKILEIFGDSKYHKILVVWNTQDNFAQIPQLAEEKYGFEVLGLREMVEILMRLRVTRGSRDDVLRIMELVSFVRQEERELEKKIDKLAFKEKMDKLIGEKNEDKT